LQFVTAGACRIPAQNLAECLEGSTGGKTIGRQCAQGQDTGSPANISQGVGDVAADAQVTSLRTRQAAGIAEQRRQGFDGTGIADATERLYGGQAGHQRAVLERREERRGGAGIVELRHRLGSSTANAPFGIFDSTKQLRGDGAATEAAEAGNRGEANVVVPIAERVDQAFERRRRAHCRERLGSDPANRVAVVT